MYAPGYFGMWVAKPTFLILQGACLCFWVGARLARSSSYAQRLSSEAWAWSTILFLVAHGLLWLGVHLFFAVTTAKPTLQWVAAFLVMPAPIVASTAGVAAGIALAVARASGPRG